MNETKSNPESNHIDRRAFLKKIAGLGAKAALVTTGADIVKREIQNNTDGYFWVDGVGYHGLYENHAEGSKEVLPDDANGLFIEFNLVDSERKPVHLLPSTSLDKIMTILVHRKDNRKLETIPNTYQLITKAVDQGVVMALGVVAFDYKDIVANDKNKFYAGILTALSGIVPVLASNIDDNLSRRKLLKLGGAGIVAAGSHMMTGSYMSNELAKASLDSEGAVARFLSRLQGLVSSAHPEDPGVFVRNAVMALKIKMMGEYLKQINKNPKICFSAGATHGGIEDFIALPNEILRFLIKHAHEQFSQEMTEVYGKDVGVVRLFTGQAGVKNTFWPTLNYSFSDLIYLEDKSFS